jgi:peptidoglycan-N-acetylmuramic acid deacetylase
VIGNHTNHHKDLPTLSNDGIKTDIMDFQNKFTSQYPNAKPPTFMRPPKGRFDEKTLTVARDNNLRTMLWSIAIKDWGKSPIDHVASANLISKRIHNGAIILMHITNAGVPKTVENLLSLLTEKGYTIGNPTEI